MSTDCMSGPHQETAQHQSITGCLVKRVAAVKASQRDLNVSVLISQSYHN